MTTTPSGYTSHQRGKKEGKKKEGRGAAYNLLSVLDERCVVLDRGGSALLHQDLVPRRGNHQGFKPLHPVHRFSVPSSRWAHPSIFDHVWVAQAFSNFALNPSA